MKKKMRNFLVLFAIGISGLAAAPADEIRQVRKGGLTVDGKLDDWGTMPWYPLVLTPGGSEFKPSEDLDVRVSFAFDGQRFYIAVSALDNVSETVDRGWRYGDGFIWTLVNDDQTASAYQIQLGFAKGQKILVYKNGVYFLRPAPPGVEFQSSQDGLRSQYEVSIPLDVLKPFDPFIHETRSMNVIYVDRDEGRRKHVVVLTPDSLYDTEASPIRKGRPFRMIPVEADSASEAGFRWSIAKNFYRAGEAVRIDWAFNVFEETTGGQLRVEAAKDSRLAGEILQVLPVKKGIQAGSLRLQLGDVPTGSYELRGRLTADQRREIASYQEKIFVLNQKESSDLISALAAYRNRPELAPSLSILEIRFQWFEDFYKGAGFEDIAPLSAWWDDIRTLGTKLRNGQPALFEPGAVRRLAHRSAIDETLQPYSVALPQDFSPDKRYPLIIGLHGSGVDERNVIDSFASRLRPLGCVVLAPKARGISDYYLGDSGRDVFECIEHFCSLYPNVDKTRVYLLGFSMGGYGVWRLGLLHPGYFKGLIVMSGVVVPRGPKAGENILDLLDKAQGQSILIVHGAKDDAAPVDLTRRAVERLKSLGADFEYIEIPDASHGNYDRWADVVDWIRRH